MKKIVKVTSLVGIILYFVGSVLAGEPANLKNAIGITIMFLSMFLFGGIVTIELIRQKKIRIED